MRLIDADVLKQHIDKLPALPDGNFAGNHSALKALINMQPTIEPSTNCSEFPNSSDTISRQAAIDIERNATVDTNPSHFEAHQKFTQFMDDAEISSFGRWQWSNGFNTALTAVGIDLKKLPPAQPEPKKGKWVYGEDSTANCVDGYRCSQCGFFVPWDYNHKFIDYINDYAYCPHCGARMKGAANGKVD